MEVLCFEHGGVLCAVPQAQVLEAADHPEGDETSLWEPLARTQPRRWLLSRGRAGQPLRIGSSTPVLRQLASADVHPLSPLLRTMLFAHVVGWCELDDQVLWLVDLSRVTPA